MRPPTHADHGAGRSAAPFALLLIVALMAAHPAVSTATPIWQDEVTISEFPMWTLTGPAIATGSDGEVHIVWSEQVVEDLGEQVFYRSGHGTTWNPVVQLSDSYQTMDPSVAVDHAGRVHVVWDDGNNGMDAIFYRRLESGVWTPAVRLNNDVGRRSARPRLAADPDGTVHLVWQQGETYPLPPEMKIYYARWDGSAWSPQECLTDDATRAVEPAIAVAPNGDVHVLWQEDRTGSDQIYHRALIGGVWSDREGVGGGSDPIRHADIAVSPTGVVHAVAVIEQAARDRAAYTKLLATGWGAWAPLTATASTYPRLATSRCGAQTDVHIVWQEYGASGLVIQYMNIHGNVFGNPEPVTHGEGDALYPAIAVDPICNLEVVWQDNRESYFMQGVYYREGVTAAAGVDPIDLPGSIGVSCAPNPFTAGVTFRLAQGVAGVLRIFDASGRTVRSLPLTGADARSISWDGRNDAGERLAPGVFFYRLEGAGETGHIVLVR